MKMEILLEPTLNKLMEDISIKRTDKLGDSDVYTLEDPTLILEIMSRRFFLRLNLPDHRSVLNGSGVKMEMQIPHSSRVKFIATCSYSRLNDFITSRKNDPKLLQTLISTSSLMVDLSEDIQCAGSDTRPLMLDRTDFASWQQRIRLYCLGKENGVNILKSIDEGPFQMGTFRETLAEGTEG
ncbi:hypothetical protein Tco_0961768, partial [Tanacetum coccineum]